MAEGEDDKPRVQASIPPSRAEHAAKKLGLRPTSGRFDAVKGPEPKASVPPAAQPSVRPAEAAPASDPRPALAASTTRPPATTDEASAARDARFAARRSLVAGETPAPEPPAPKAKAPARSPLKSPIVIGGGGLLLLGALVFGSMTFMRLRYEGSDEGRVRGRLTDVELAPHDTALRDAAYGELDAMPNGPKTAVEMLSDTKVAERGTSRSTHKMQELANQYLIHFAAFKKSDPPPKAVEMAKLIFEGQNPNAEQWNQLQQAWRAWLPGK
jgi:hypothetical protein